MLSLLLPGLRDVRAPLTAGAIWLATIWVVFFDDLSKKHSSGSLWHATRVLIDSDRVIAGGVMLFVALIIGATAVPLRVPPHALTNLVDLPDIRQTLELPYRDVGHPYREWLADRATAIQTALNPRGATSFSRRNSLPNLVSRALDNAVANGWAYPAIAERLALWDRWRIAEICDQFPIPGVRYDGNPYGEDITRDRLAKAITSAVRDENELLATRLHMTFPAKHDEYERLSSEGTYRIGVVIPLSALLFALAIRVDQPLILVALAVPIVFGIQGLRRYYEGRSILDLAVEQRIVESDVLAAVEGLHDEPPVDVETTEWATSAREERENRGSDSDLLSDSQSDEQLEQQWKEEALRRSYTDGSGWKVRAWPLVIFGALVGFWSAYGATRAEPHWQVLLLFVTSLLVAWMCAIPLLSVLPGRWPREMYEQWDLRRWTPANLPAMGAGGSALGLAIGSSSGGVIDGRALAIGGCAAVIVVIVVVCWIGRTER